MQPKQDIDPDQGHNVEELEGEKTHCDTLKYFAGCFSYSNPDKFRQAILQSGRIPWRRMSRKRIVLRVKDIPGF